LERDSPFWRMGGRVFPRPTLPITYRVKLGRRFDAPADVPTFTAELDQYYRQVLEGAPQSRWLPHA
jgi:hypothetical protein